MTWLVVRLTWINVIFKKYYFLTSLKIFSWNAKDLETIIYRIKHHVQGTYIQDVYHTGNLWEVVLLVPSTDFSFCMYCCLTFILICLSLFCLCPLFSISALVLFHVFNSCFCPAPAFHIFCLLHFFFFFRGRIPPSPDPVHLFLLTYSF